MPILLGLSAALLWGASDLLVRIAGRVVGVPRLMFYAQGLGALATAAWIAVAGPGFLMPLGAFAAALAISLLGLLATAALFTGLRIGPVGLVAPLASAYGAVTAVLSLASGEPLGWFVLGGLALVLLGGVLVASAQPAAADHPAASASSAGTVWALIACVSFGAQFWLQGRYLSPRLGAIVPVWFYYTLSTGAVGASAMVRGTTLALPPANAAIVFLTGVFAVGGYVALSAALATGAVAVPTALASLHGAVTVGLAATFLKEHVGRWQWLGVVTIALGVALVRIP